MNNIQYLYHITRLENFNSIQEYGLGACKGVGINMEKSVSGKIYMLDFDPVPFLNNLKDRTLTNIEKEQKNMIDWICYLLNYDSNYAGSQIIRMPHLDLIVIKIQTNGIEKRNLVKDPIENFVYIYYGTITHDKFTHQYFQIQTHRSAPNLVNQRLNSST